MGAGGSQGIIPASGVATFFDRGVQLGTLRSVSVVVTSGAPGPTDSNVVGLLSDSGTDWTRMSAMILTGFVTVDTPLIWSGEIELTGGELVVTRCNSLAAVTLFTSFNIQIPKG